MDESRNFNKTFTGRLVRRFTRDQLDTEKLKLQNLKGSPSPSPVRTQESKTVSTANFTESTDANQTNHRTSDNFNQESVALQSKFATAKAQNMTKWASGEPSVTQRLPDSGSLNLVKILKEQSESEIEKLQTTDCSNSSTTMPALDKKRHVIESMENIFQ